MTKFWIILSALIVAGVSAYAGGLSDAITEAAPAMAAPADPESSIAAWVIPVILVALLAGVALSGDDDDDDVEEMTAES